MSADEEELGEIVAGRILEAEADGAAPAVVRYGQDNRLSEYLDLDVLSLHTVSPYFGGFP